MLSVAKHPMKTAPTHAALSFYEVLRLLLSPAPCWDSSLRSEVGGFIGRCPTSAAVSRCGTWTQSNYPTLAQSPQRAEPRRGPRRGRTWGTKQKNSSIKPRAARSGTVSRPRHLCGSVSPPSTGLFVRALTASLTPRKTFHAKAHEPLASARGAATWR